MITTYCFLWMSPCLSISDWKDISLIVGTCVAIPGVLIAAYKTWHEIKKLREQRDQERHSRVHKCQLEILGKIYKCLDDVQGYSQLMTKSVTFEGENPDEYPKLLGRAVIDARNEFAMGRLLLPVDVVTQIDTFFKKIFEGQYQLSMARYSMVQDGSERVQFWNNTGAISFQEMPALLRTIEDKARTIIHGEEND